MSRHRQMYLILALSFLLGVQNGNIALWKQGQTEPVRVFPYRCDSLPPQARAALEQGIPIDSIEQLEQLAENYLS